jgi:acyl-CoA thioester hydrolase
MKIFIDKIQITKKDVDQNGHLNNVVYVQWMQDVAMKHSAAVGYDWQKYQELGTSWIIKSHFIEYKSPGFEGEDIELQTWVFKHEKLSSLRKYRFVRPSDGRLLAVAETNWVYVDSSNGRPRRIDQEVADAFPLVPAGEEPS